MTPPDVEAVVLWRNDWKHSPMPWVGVKWEKCERPAGSTEYRALPAPAYAALLARLNEAEARANTAKVAADLMRARAEKSERERDALRGEVATIRGARSAEDVCEMLCEASCVDVTPERCARIWSLLEHPATTMTTLAVIADERGESYAKVAAERDEAVAALRRIMAHPNAVFNVAAVGYGEPTILKIATDALTRRG